MIEITTFGTWDIKKDGESVLETKGHQEKLLKLFKYLLLFENRRLISERIIEDLFGEEDYYDPKNTLRTQMSRVRYMFSYNDFFSIKHMGGYYIFTLEQEATIDFKEFENKLIEGNLLMATNPVKAIGLIKEGLKLYKGGFLLELNEDWIVPQRIRFNRLYIKSIYNYLSFLKAEDKYNKIIELVEKAIEYHPYEELLNIYLIEALIKLNQRQYALSHYEYFTSKLYNDLKIKPSEEIKNLYEAIKDEQGQLEDTKPVQVNKMDSGLIGESENRHLKLIEEDSWNLEFFNSIYENKPIHGEKIHEKCDYFILISLRSDLYQGDIDNIKSDMDKLNDIINKGLRSGDAHHRCKEGPILLTLYDISYFEIQMVGKRLEAKLVEETRNPSIELDIKIQPVKK